MGSAPPLFAEKALLNFSSYRVHPIVVPILRLTLLSIMVIMQESYSGFVSGRKKSVHFN